MKEVFIAYFDFLGFKEFILNNDDQTLSRRMGHIFRDIEASLGKGKYLPPQDGIILADLSNSKINCLNISDTVIFWTNDLKLDSLKEIIKVSYDFNWKENLYNFPLRGIVTKGKIKIVDGSHKNFHGSTYRVNCLYGKGIVDAHLKAESQNWAGTIIDSILISEFDSLIDAETFLNDYAIRYGVPFKNNTECVEEYAFRLVKNELNELSYENIVNDIIRVFSQDNKSINNKSVQEKIKNTIEYLSIFKKN